jgi:hypothetical protein
LLQQITKINKKNLMKGKSPQIDNTLQKSLGKKFSLKENKLNSSFFFLILNVLPVISTAGGSFGNKTVYARHKTNLIQEFNSTVKNFFFSSTRVQKSASSVNTVSHAACPKRNQETLCILYCTGKKRERISHFP